MPTILRIGPYRFFFYSNETGEVPHIHIAHDSRLAKFWLEPIELARSKGFAPHELTRLETLVTDSRKRLLEAWHEYFES